MPQAMVLIFPVAKGEGRLRQRAAVRANAPKFSKSCNIFLEAFVQNISTN